MKLWSYGMMMKMFYIKHINKEKTMKESKYKIIYTKALIDVKDKIQEIKKKYSSCWDNIEVNFPLELIDNAINELHAALEKETK